MIHQVAALISDAAFCQITFVLVCIVSVASKRSGDINVDRVMHRRSYTKIKLTTVNVITDRLPRC